MADTNKRETLRAVEEFERQYAERSGVTVDWLHENGRWGAPCDCREEGCEGFQMLREPSDAWDHKRLELQGLLRYIGRAS